MPSKLHESSKSASQQAGAGTAERVGEAQTSDPVAKAIATELAPEVAIALLAKTGKKPDSPEPALMPIGAGVSTSEDDEKIRLQLVFESGAVLPVQLAKDAGASLIHGLKECLGEDSPGSS